MGDRFSITKIKKKKGMIKEKRINMFILFFLHLYSFP